MYAKEYPLVAPEDAIDREGLDGKAAVLVESENHNAVLDSAIACKFSRGVLTDERLATLLDTTTERLDAVGARIVDIERHVNNERGFDRSDDDALPYELPEFDEALSAYYERRGWRPDGAVPSEKIDP